MVVREKYHQIIQMKNKDLKDVFGQKMQKKILLRLKDDFIIDLKKYSILKSISNIILKKYMQSFPWRPLLIFALKKF